MLKKKEHSCGIIPLRKTENQWQVLLVKHEKGHWAFPKGHTEPQESPKQTAERELFEETALRVDAFLDVPQLQESYFFQQGTLPIEKTVTYFLALVSGNIQIQKEEINDYRWLSIVEAEALVTFPEARKICQSVREILT